MRLCLILGFLLYPLSSLAEVSVYTIEGYIHGAFPEPPRFVGEIGKGNQRHRSYQSADEANLLVYAVTWQVGKTKFRNEDVHKAIQYYIGGDASVINGDVVSVDYRQIDNNNGAHYIIDYQLDNLQVRKYSAVIYRDGQFFAWSIQEFPGLSRLRAADIFQSFVQYFSVE